MPDPRLVSLNHRLRNLAAQEGVPPQRVRNRYVFQRVLARLARDPRWVLKGGFSLELRLGLAARTTKDLDLLRWDASGLSANDLQDLLDEALEVGLGDDCTFTVRRPRQVRTEEEMPSTWRVVVDVQVARSPFETVTIDVVTSGADDRRGRCRSASGSRRRALLGAQRRPGEARCREDARLRADLCPRSALLSGERPGGPRAAGRAGTARGRGLRPSGQ